MKGRFPLEKFFLISLNKRGLKREKRIVISEN